MDKIALMFPGQGSQFTGMGKKLHDKYLEVREIYEEANDVLGFDLGKLCFEGSEEELLKTENAQPAILTASVAVFKVYMKEIGIVPSYCAGHSLGEYSALVCAGAIRFSEALRIVRSRGLFMQEAVSHGKGAMVAVSGIDKSIVEEKCKEYSSKNNFSVISNYNSSVQVVISGHKDMVLMVKDELDRLGARTVQLKVSAPFHCPLMYPAAIKLKWELEKCLFNEMEWPVISNVTALPYTGKDEVVENLVSQITYPVKWQQTIEFMQSNGVTKAIELGPQSILKNLIAKNTSTIKAFSYDKEEDIQELLKLISSNESKFEKDYNNFNLLYKCLAVAVSTRNQNWDDEKYKTGVVEPYKKIQHMIESLENVGVEPSAEQIQEALSLLRCILNTKMLPLNEQQEWLKEVMEA